MKKRKSKRIRIIRIRVKGGWALATAHETSHPNLFVTACRMVYGKQGRKFLVAESDHLFVVTHKPTGRRMSDALTLEEAKVLAERYAASGIPFEKIRTRRSAEQYREVADKIRNSFNQWRTACCTWDATTAARSRQVGPIAEHRLKIAASDAPDSAKQNGRS